MANEAQSPHAAMQRADALLSHVWMVRTFLKHSDEAADDEEVAEIYRTLYDAMLALGPAYNAGDPSAYFRQLRKKIGRLRRAAETFAELQPEVSTHTNFIMAARSLQTAVDDLVRLLEGQTV